MIMNVIITSASTSRIVATAFGDKTRTLNVGEKSAATAIYFFALLDCFRWLRSFAASSAVSPRSGLTMPQ